MFLRLPCHISLNLRFQKLLAYLLNWTLFGALSVQVCESENSSKFIGRLAKIFLQTDIYYLAFPEDPIRRKVLVYAVYAAELVQAILLAKMAYTQLAAGFGNFQAINNIGLLWFAVPTLGSIGMYYHPVFFLAATYK